MKRIYSCYDMECHIAEKLSLPSAWKYDKPIIDFGTKRWNRLQQQQKDNHNLHGMNRISCNPCLDCINYPTNWNDLESPSGLFN